MLELYFFNVGHGDSIAINFPNNQWGIVDCNRSERTYDPPILKFLKSNGISSLEFVCITHPHLDHFRGLNAIISHYKKNINKLIIYGITKNNHEVGESDLAKGIKQFLELYKSRVEINKHLIWAEKGTNINIGEVKVKCLNPTLKILKNLLLDGVLAKDSEYNNASVILLLEYKNRKILLNGDSTIKNWLEIFKENKNLKSDIVKISHHGSKNNNNIEVLSNIIKNKAKTIISTDGGTKYKHIPSKEVINILKNKFQSEVLETNILTTPQKNNKFKIKNEIEDLVIDTLCEDKEQKRILYDGYIKVSIDDNGLIKSEFVNSVEQ